MRIVSLGHGTFPEDGPVTFFPNDEAELWNDDGRLSLTWSSDDSWSSSWSSNASSSSSSCIRTQEEPFVGGFQMEIHDIVDTIEDKSVVLHSTKASSVSGDLYKTFFMRCSDLDIDLPRVEGNYKAASQNSERGIHHDDENETWVALCTGDGKHSSLASVAVYALIKTGLDIAMDASIWTPEKKTEKLLAADKTYKALGFGFENIPNAVNTHDDVLVWTGSISKDDLPAVRSIGIINSNAKAVLDLLMDSSRVKEYNKMSIGRRDLVVLQDDDDATTKIVQSDTKPPLLRKTLRFESLLHAQKLDDNAGYVIVTRAVKTTPGGESDDNDSDDDSNILYSKVLLGVNMIRNLQENRCIMINVHHLRPPPMVPAVMAKTFGLTAAVNFIHDIRKALC